jgi:hypothetical protein
VSSYNDVDIELTCVDRKEETNASEEQNQKTLKPSKSPVITTKPLPRESRSENLGRSASDSFVEDHSDLALGIDETGLESKLSQLKVSPLSKSN